jgi:hypothetical protein
MLASVPGRRVRVLADQQHPDLVEGLGERAQHVGAGRQVAPAGGHLGAQELTHVGDHRRDRRQRPRPSGLDDLLQRLARHHASSRRSSARKRWGRRR